MTFAKVLVTVLTAALMVGCSRSNSSRWNAPAPQSAADVGLIVQVKDGSLAPLFENENVRARVLHAKEGLYEVFGISPDLLPEGAHLIESNAFFENLVPDDRALIRNNITMRLEALLSNCRRDSQGPTAEISFLAPGMKSHDTIIRFGQQVYFDSKSSRVHRGLIGVLSATWFVRAPIASKIPARLVTQPTLSFRPDAVGRYDLTLIVRDSAGRCESTSSSFAVTADPARIPARGKRRMTPEQLREFFHLAEIRAVEAWQFSRGASVLLAIVDTGVNYNHPDIEPNIYRNPRESANGHDDDGNGLVDDVFGWDFSNNDGRPFDDGGHGSHVAGLAGATTFGVAPDIKILPVKVLNAMGSGDIASISAGIMYAADQGARIINTSLGSMDPNFKMLHRAIEYAIRKGALVVTAAGNGPSGTGTNIDVTPMYPASFEEPEVVAVAASHGAQLSSYSNFGANAVDIAAPGGDGKQLIRSLASTNANRLLYVEKAGTSMAAPLVAGAAALLMDLNPEWTPKQVHEALTHSGTYIPRLTGLIRSSQRLNTFEAIRGSRLCARQCAPSSP